jgi:hypothetical protein
VPRRSRAASRCAHIKLIEITTANAKSPGGQFVLHAKALPGNPYDGHTLKDVSDATEALTGREIECVYVDKGYRGHNAPKPLRVFRSGQKRGVFGTFKRELKRRANRPYQKRWTSWPEPSQGPQRRCRQRHPIRHRI